MKISMRYSMLAACMVNLLPLAAITLSAQETAPLKLWHSFARKDNFVTATAVGEAGARADGYGDAGVEALVFAELQPGTVPLKLFYSATRGDNFTTATADGQEAALNSGYSFVRFEGYVYPEPRAGTLPLKLYYSDALNENFTFATPTSETNARNSGYRFVRIEGYAFPAGAKPKRDPKDDSVAPAPAPALARAQRSTYFLNAPVVIQYSGLPGNAQDWIAVSKRGDPDNTYGKWEYTGGKTSGTITIPAGLAPGDYEVRVYFNWPSGGFNVQSRTTFSVGNRAQERIDDIVLPSNLARPTRVSYAANEAITIQYSGLPGNAQDWITVVRRGDPDHTQGLWQYTSGKRSGTFSLPNGLGPGEYEVRVFFDWPKGGYTVQSRTTFTVTAGG